MTNILHENFLQSIIECIFQLQKQKILLKVIYPEKDMMPNYYYEYMGVKDMNELIDNAILSQAKIMQKILEESVEKA